MQMNWDMNLLGAAAPSQQKMCATPIFCSQTNDDACSWMRPILENMGLGSIGISNCQQTCIAGTPVKRKEISTTVKIPVTDDVGSTGSDLECPICNITSEADSSCEVETCEEWADTCLTITYDVSVEGNKKSASQKRCGVASRHCNLSNDQMCKTIQETMLEDSSSEVSNCQIGCTNFSGK